jgi:F0F1-type ATP synthase assembly protein I
MITLIIGFIVGFATGFLVFRNNAAKVNALEAKAKAVADEFKK